MYKHILVPTDGSRLAAKGVRARVKLAKALGAKVTGVYAVMRRRLPQSPSARLLVRRRMAGRVEEHRPRHAGIGVIPNGATINLERLVGRTKQALYFLLRHALRYA